jgi:hypothetical protein
MATKVQVFYFGDDEAFFKALQGEFAKHVRMPMEFKRFFSARESEIQSFFLDVFRSHPAAVFIDFSKHTQDYLHLARIINRTPLEHTCVSVGLMDYLSPPEILIESMATGVKLSYIKSAETFDIVYAVTKLIAPSEIGEHGFATANLEEDIEGGVPCKIGYIHPSGLHLETDFKLGKGMKARLNHHWQQKKIVPSAQVFVKEVSSADIFYHFKYNADVEFLFVDEVIPLPDMDPADLKERTQEREELVSRSKKQLSKWLQSNLDTSLEKLAKVLVIDRQFNVYDHQPRSDTNAYTLRCLPFVVDLRETLERFRPQVIVFALEEEAEGAKNTFEALETLVKAVKSKFSDQPPFLIVFNCKSSSAVLQQTLSYQQAIASDAELSGELLQKICSVFLSKLKAMAPVKSDTVFLRKTNIASVCEIALSLKMLKISESDILFQSDVEIPEGMNLHFKHPVEMYVHVTPAKTQGSKLPQYLGIIHSIGEGEKKELRRYINGIFFRDHDEKKRTELEAYQTLNTSKLQEKLDAIKREQEAKLAEQEAQERGAAEDAAKLAQSEMENEAGPEQQPNETDPKEEKTG